MAPENRCRSVGLERPAAPVLEPQRLAVVVAEGGHREVEVAVAVEVAGPHVGDPRNALGRDAAREALLAVVLEHHDRADAQVARKELAEARDEQVEVAVAVEVGGLHVRGGADVLGDGRLGPRPGRELAYPGDPVADRVAGQDVGQAVAVEVGDGDVRDLGPLGVAARLADGPRREEVRRRSLGQDGAARVARGPGVGRAPPHAHASAQSTPAPRPRTTARGTIALAGAG